MPSNQERHSLHHPAGSPHKLEPRINTPQLWGIAVGLVISGEYFGWSYGWGFAGTLGFLVSWVVVSVIYICIVFSYIELSTAIPHAGGAFAYVRRSFGPVLAYVSGFSALMAFLFVEPTVSLAIGAYLHLQFTTIPDYYIAAIAFVIFGAINIIGVSVSVMFELIITVIAIIELLVFVGVVGPGFTWSNFLQGAWSGKNSLTPDGLKGILHSIPFAVWFYLGIEGAVMVAEEVKDFKKVLPVAMGAALFTLMVLALLVMIFAGGVGDWTHLASINDPLPMAMRNVVDQHSPLMHMLIWIGLFGLLASFHGMFIAISRQAFAQARAGYVPKWLADVHPKFKTPWKAIMVTIVVGIVLVLNDKHIQIDGQPLAAVLMQLAMFAIMTMNFLAMLALFKLRHTEPNLPRPYKVFGYPWVTGVALLGSGALLLSMTILRPQLAGFFVVLIVLGFIPFYFKRKSREVSLAEDLLQSAQDRYEEKKQ